MIKFNWGTGIFIVIALIFAGVITFYIYISRLDNNLVESNYYEKELVYQERIQKTRNADNLPERIRIKMDRDLVTFQFPDTVRNLGLQGTLWFYRPSDETKDFTLPIALDDSLRQAVERQRMLPGKYVVKMEWEMDGVHYYQEEVLVNQ